MEKALYKQIKMIGLSQQPCTDWAPLGLLGFAEAGEHYSTDGPELEESYNHPPDMVCALQKLGAGENHTFFPTVNTIWPLFKQSRKYIHKF